MITKNEIKFIRSLASKKEREAAGLFVAEGDKLIDDLSSTMEVKQVFRVGQNCTVADMERISMLKTPSSALALIEMPNTTEFLAAGSAQALATDSANKGSVLILDAVQDPGNLGTIIRTADWFGVSRIICSHDTADAFAPKVVQATMGAIARVKILYTDLPEWLSAQVGRKIYGTFLEQSSPLRKVDFDGDAIIVMGNEGRGISDAVARYVTDRVFIERGDRGGGESLNVAIATAIILSRL